MQEARETLFEHVVFSREFDATDPDAVAAALAKLDLAEAEREELRQQMPKIAVYRRLIHATLRDAMELGMPRLVARLGRLFDEYFERFLSEQAPATHYLRDVTPEFLAFVAPLWPVDARIPAWAHDLGRHESLRIEVAAAVNTPIPEVPEGLELERGVRFTEACRLVRYEYAVHQLSADIEDRSEPKAARTHLLVYRSPEHDVRYLELSPVAAEILGGLLQKRLTLGQALTEAYSAHGIALSESELQGVARLLADLAARGALLGPATEPTAGSIQSSPI
ncbi:MAG: hypothetical protein SFV15_08125 [Polyangiaceae bacterium]|nr:hypothetical protein [Polyangiaceae bacterium]